MILLKLNQKPIAHKNYVQLTYYWDLKILSFYILYTYSDKYYYYTYYNITYLIYVNIYTFRNVVIKLSSIQL